ncbi:MAG: DUF2218 domain-containing protein [Pseudomonadota bacterium]
MQATAIFKTEQAGRYVRALCDHFGSQASAGEPPFEACITLGFGQCHLARREGALKLHAQAKDSAQLTQVTELMTRYVERVAFRENPQLHWRAVTDEGAQRDDPTEINTRT